MVTYSNDIIQNLYELGSCLAIFFLGLSIPGMGGVASQVFLQCAILCHFISILLFPVPLNHQYSRCSKHYWFILTICIYGRYLGVETMVQFLFLMLWQPISEWHFGHGNMTCWPKCNVCVLEARIRYV